MKNIKLITKDNTTVKDILLGCFGNDNMKNAISIKLIIETHIISNLGSLFLTFTATITSYQFSLIFIFIIINDFVNPNYRNIKINPFTMFIWLIIYFFINYFVYKFIKNKIKRHNVIHKILFLLIIIIQLFFAYFFVIF